MSLPPRVRRLLRVRDPARDVDEELDFHFARTVEDLVSRGWSEGAARHEAERRFGDLAWYRGELESIDQGRARSERRRYRIAAVWDVTHHAARSLVRSPGLAVAVVLTLGLGLGVNVGMYGIVDRLLLSPPPHVASPDEVRRVMIEVGSPDAVPTPILTFPDFSDLADGPGLSGAAVWSE
jgi:putative ABC transport system permease protein